MVSISTLIFLQKPNSTLHTHTLADLMISSIFAAIWLLVVGIFSGLFGRKYLKFSVPLLCLTIVAGATCLSTFPKITSLEGVFVYLAILCAFATCKYEKFGLLCLVFIASWTFCGSFVVKITGLIDDPNPPTQQQKSSFAASKKSPPNSCPKVPSDLVAFLGNCLIFGILKLQSNIFMSLLQCLAAFPWFFAFGRWPEAVAVAVFSAIGSWLAALGTCKLVGVAFGFSQLANWRPAWNWTSMVVLAVVFGMICGSFWFQYVFWIPSKAAEDEQKSEKKSDTEKSEEEQEKPEEECSD